LLGLAFATGFTGLAYEAIWHRYLNFLFGSNMKASALVTGIFLAAMSGGCAGAGRLVRKNPAIVTRLYGWAEIALGLWAAAFPFLYSAAGHAPPSFGAANILADTALTAVLIAPPAIVMGATIPVFTFLLRKESKSLSKNHALLYAANTLGAFAGIALAGFYLIHAVGLRGSLWLLAPVNLAVGAAFLAGLAGAEAAKHEPAKAARTPSQVRTAALLGAVALSSFSYLALENWLIRIGAIATEGSSMNFIVVVGAFVLLTGLGALAASVRGLRRPTAPFWALGISCASWLALFLTVDLWPYAVYILDGAARSWGAGLSGLFAMRLAILALVLAPAVVPAGAFLPFAFTALDENSSTRWISTSGAVYAASALGLALGAVIGGYAVFHRLDLEGGFQFALALQIAALVFAGYAVRLKETLPPVAALVLLFATVSLPSLDKDALALSYYFLDSKAGESVSEAAARKKLYDFYGVDRVLAFETGPEGSVAVLRETSKTPGGERLLAVNGSAEATSGPNDREANALTALLGYLLASNPENALVVGLGSGVTAGTLAHMKGVERVDGLELSAEVIRQAPQFDAATFGASSNPKLRMIAIDAVRYLNSEGPRYGIVASMPPNLWISGVENLYTKRFYKAVDRRLSDGGFFFQWVPDWSVSPEMLATVVRTMSEVFGDVTLWRLSRHHIGVAAQKGDAPYGKIPGRATEEPYREALKAVRGEDPLLPLFLQTASPEMSARIAPRGGVHDSDFPVIGWMSLKEQHARRWNSQSLSLLKDESPPAAGVSHGFYLAGYQRRFGRFNAARLGSAKKELCSRLQPLSAPCRYAALALAKEETSPW
jgi:spermidine synthase